MPDSTGSLMPEPTLAPMSEPNLEPTSTPLPAPMPEPMPMLAGSPTPEPMPAPMPVVPTTELTLSYKVIVAGYYPINSLFRLASSLFFQLYTMHSPWSLSFFGYSFLACECHRKKQGTSQLGCLSHWDTLPLAPESCPESLVRVLHLVS